MIAETFFDKCSEDQFAPDIFGHVSSRGFATYTGTYKGVPVTVIGTGMGYSMIDFSIRECTAVIKGPIAMIRVGTCGSVDRSLSCGEILVADRAVFLSRNPNAFRESHEEKKKSEIKTVTTFGSHELSYYKLSVPVFANADITKMVSQSNLTNSLVGRQCKQNLWRS